jgi:enterochelin esterase family protein
MLSLLDRAHAEGTPLLDDGRATFVWEGEPPPRLVGDFNGWGSAGAPATALSAVAPGVWTATLTLPRDAYIEYAYFQGEARVPDPLNPHTVWNGVDGDNHYLMMPDYLPTPLTRRMANVVRGRVTHHIVRGGYLVAGGKRAVHLYAPPAKEPASLLVVFDGQDYLHRALLPTIADNLIGQGTIRPVALALVEHGRQARAVEYACSEATLAFLMRCVLPLARERLHLLDPAAEPGAYGALGASMGGLMALYTALRLPRIFGRALSQSGAFGFGLPELEPSVLELARQPRSTDIKVWMDVGRYEFLLGSNQRMRAALAEAGAAVTYREYPGGHNYTCWRDEIGRGLAALFVRGPGD